MFFIDISWISWTLKHQAGQRLLSVIANEMPIMSLDHRNAGTGELGNRQNGQAASNQVGYHAVSQSISDTPTGSLAVAAASLIGRFHASLFHDWPFFRARSGVAGSLPVTCFAKKPLMLCGTVI